MFNQTAGEWVLRLSTSPENAAAIIGDLIQCQTTGFSFWRAIASNVLHAMTPKVFGTAIAVFCLQSVIFVVSVFVTMFFLWQSPISITVWRWYALVTCLITEIIAGLWIGRRKQDRSALVCMLVILFNCAGGLLNWNNASINMAFWSLPVLLGTLAAYAIRTRREVRRLS